MTTAVRTRPFLVTLLVVLVVLGAIGWILTGVIFMTTTGSLVVAGVTAIGIVYILLGLAYLVVARGLLNGDPRARMVVIVVASLQLVFAVIGWLVTTNQLQNGRSSGTGSGLLALVILIVLFLPKVREFFGHRAV